MSKKRPTAKELKDTLNAFIFTADDMAIDLPDAMRPQKLEAQTNKLARVATFGEPAQDDRERRTRDKGGTPGKLGPSVIAPQPSHHTRVDIGNSLSVAPQRLESE